MTILHKSNVTNKEARVSVLFDKVEGGEKSHPFLEKLNIQPKDNFENDATSQLTLKDLFSEEKEQMALLYYSGSIPYPPCTENVDWFIYNQPLGISDSQLEAIQSHFTNNYRNTHNGTMYAVGSFPSEE